MHPHLDVPEKQLACREFISALEACHAKGFWPRLSGACNGDKHALSMCLKQERIERTTRNRENAKERNKKSREALARYDQEKAEAEGR
ncbi:hypothetical protein BCR39DRAFT_555665 [Naematelia encephala]|uniref:COX assembly mitochondrial protein n=1 Tax=Naematelia encephala TaxID=71784 RepID=A0A1Y2BLQ6_9TREE|nr:hypothetical protein BCR39DRAFT_555665 [Naematelia encephala]